jgi:hypothetical protein
MKKLEILKDIVSETRLTWNEKALISLISRYQNTGVTFTLTDNKTASELGLKESSIYGLVSNLAKMNVIAKHTDSKQINAGQKPKNVRYITLKNSSEWFTTENKTNTDDLSHVNENNDETVVDADINAETQDIEQTIVTENAVIVDNKLLEINIDEINTTDKVINSIRQKIKEGYDVNFVNAKIIFDNETSYNDLVCRVHDPINPLLKYVTQYEINKK